MKTILLLLAFALFIPFSFSTAKAESNSNDVKNDLLEAILVAENDDDDDEDLFMDDEEEDEEVAEESNDDAEEEEEEEEVTSDVEDVEEEEVVEEEPAPAPVKKAKPVAAKKPTPRKRAPANFKGGFKVLAMDCQLHSDADDSSEVILSTRSGKKLWLDGHNEGWYKGYHKKGHGYFPAGCFE